MISGVSHVRSWLRSWVAGGRVADRMGGPRLQEVTIEDVGAQKKIAVIDIEGIINSGFLDGGGYSMVDLLKYQLKHAREDPDVVAVVLRVNTPGGEVMAADDMYRAIADFQRESHKPVVAAMGSVAASGGYYVSAPCRWIVANELSITGSIGVIMHGYNYRGLMDKIGLRPEVYKSGKFKDMMSGDRSPAEILPEERQMLQGLIDETFARFKKVVAQGRQHAHEQNRNDGRALVSNWEDYADGRVVSGKQAFDLGFVDELGGFKVAVDRAKRFVHVADANLIQYEQPFELANLFRLFGKTDVRNLKVDLGLDLPRLQVGRMYFLFMPGAR